MNDSAGKFRIALAWSLLLHAIFLALAVFVHVSSIPKPLEEERRFRMKGVDPRPIGPRAPGYPSAHQFAKRVKFASQGPSAVHSARDIAAPDVYSAPEPLKQNAVELVRNETPKPSVVGSEDLDSILLRAEEREVKDAVDTRPKRVASEFREASRKVSGSGALDAQAVVGALKRAFGGAGTSNVGIDPEEGMPGFTPLANVPFGGGGGDNGFGLDEGTGEAAGDVMRYEPLDALVDVEVETFEASGDPQKYYRLRIFAKNAGRTLKTVPKEIIFTIDCSASISPDRLDEIKSGMRYCLQRMNSGDVFNVVAFKDDVRFLFPQSVAPSADAIGRAERFVTSLEPSERTDVYGAIERIVKSPRARTPSNLLLISDGKPTQGVVNARDLINSISRVNAGARPIFAFSGGTRVNRYILDFISYQNRAWSQYIKRSTDIDEGLAAFYDKIKDPVFLNLRYELNGVNEREVFPKTLPDFYRNAEFTLYGTYSKEDKFSMQLLGDGDGKTKQLIFSRSLETAKKGTEEIRKGWAFNRVYDLVSRLTRTGDDALRREIADVSARYGVKTPYSPELERTD